MAETAYIHPERLEFLLERLEKNIKGFAVKLTPIQALTLIRLIRLGALHDDCQPAEAIFGEQVRNVVLERLEKLEPDLARAVKHA